MKIAIIGAGFSGLVNARVHREFGHDVTVFEKAPDVGGVWSSSRRYPGLRTQNDKGSYALSELKMPKSYPQWPTGEQVQEYLELYVKKFNLSPMLRLGVEVLSAEPDETGWNLTTSASPDPEHFDHLIVANGIFSEPFIPTYEGVETLEAAGGRICATSNVHSLDEVAGKHVIMVGYGKSAHDTAVELAKVAASTTVVARDLLWKVPRYIGGVVNYKNLLLTRMGEALFPYQDRRGFEKFLHGAGKGIRNGMMSTVESVSTKQLKLKQLGLVPKGKLEDIAKASISLASEGFFEAVAEGRITALRDTRIERFVAIDGKPHAELSNGQVIPADVVVCGTGHQQVVPFFSEELQGRLQDEKGSFELYRHILPHDVPNLTFGGYNSSFFSPLSAEVGAFWIASLLNGTLKLPPIEQRRHTVRDRLAWMESRTKGHHARGTFVVPFSMHNVDDVLNELGLNVSKGTRFKQWLAPVNPSAYRHTLSKLKERAGA
jgi:cation diffusion facilitator CzcD-associated flavoprotein CzcO